MLTERSLEWWKMNGGQIISFEHLQPSAVILQSPTGEQGTPRPMLIGPHTMQAQELCDLNPNNYSYLLAGPWRDYGLKAMTKLRRISESRAPESGFSVFPPGLWGDAFEYEWVTLPCRIGKRPVLVTLSQKVTLH